MKNAFSYALVLALFIFAGVTFFLSTSVIFDLFNVRASQGHYVLFIVISNFLSSLLYFIAGFGLLKKKDWAVFVLGAALSLLILVFAYFTIYIDNGGIYEQKTFAAMILRISVTAVFTLLAYFSIPNKTTL